MTTRPQSNQINSDRLQTLIPGAFVFLWSTGFIGMRYGAPHAEPFTFMAIRMAIVVSVLTVVALAAGAPWPKRRAEVGHLAVAGMLVHATYLCGVLYAIGTGLPVGFVALIAGLQPVLTALFAARWLGERLQWVQWIGMALGIVGVVLVVGSKYSLGALSAAHLAPIGFACVGLIGITVGTLYQKKYCAEMDLRTGGVVQFSATLVVLVILAFAFETRVVRWNGEFVFALLWLAFALSIGAISLLYWMIRRGAASKVASLFFLTPSVTAVMGYLLFEERLGPMAMVGFAVTAVGVALVMRRR